MTHLIIAAIVALVLAGTHWRAYVSGKNTEINKQFVVTAQANEDAREAERINQRSRNAALDNRTKEIVANVAADRRARAAVDGLRDASQRSLQAGRSNAAACLVAATAHAELLEQCTSAYRELAGQADGHVADTRALIQAWPP
jgi:Flp pilus assembly protein TadB